jgi:hypothetical protein
MVTTADPVLLAMVLGTGLLALIPVRRLARRTGSRWLIGGWYAATWLALLATLLVPGVRRWVVPLLVVLAIAPWLELPPVVARLVARLRPR